MSIGKRILSTRTELNISQEELALRVGCSQDLISKLETGKRNKTSLILKFAKVLSVHPAWLETGESKTNDLYELTSQQKKVLQAMQQMQTYEQDALVKISNSLIEPKANGTKS